MAATVSVFLFACICAVLVCTTNSQGTFSLTVRVNIYANWRTLKIDENNSQTRLNECLCKETDMTVCSSLANSPQDTRFFSQSLKLTQDKSTNSTNAYYSYFVCSIKSETVLENNFTCIPKTSESLPCNNDTCSVSIYLNCGKFDTVIVWSSQQEALLLDAQGYIPFNFCLITTNNQELTTRVSTLSTPNIITTALIRDTTLRYTTSTAVIRETTFQNAIGTKDREFSETTLFSTKKTIERPLNMEQKNADANLQFTGAHIGIIIGVLVGGILLAILIMVAIWRFKCRRRNLSAEEILPDGDKQDSHNAGNTRSASTEHFTNDRSGLQKRAVAQVSPLTSVNESNTTFNQTPENYTYIDPLMLQTTLLRNKNTYPDISGSALTNQTNVAVPESANNDSQSVYTELGESNVTLENPFNCLPPDNYYSTAAQQTSIPSNGPSLKESKQQGMQPVSKNAASQSSNIDPALLTNPSTIDVVTRGRFAEVKRIKPKNDFDNNNMATHNQAETKKESDGGQTFQEVKPYINQSETAILEQTVEPLYGNTIPESESVEKKGPESIVIETPEIYYNIL